MKRPGPVERSPMAGRPPQPADETMIDIGRPGGLGSVGQQAGRSVLSVAVATDVGRVRPNNEDYVQAERIVRDGRRYSMWAVADGVGGGPQGERASRTAVETVVDYLANEPWTDPSVALTEAFALANRNVYEITGEGSAASTMVVALVSEPEGVVCIANVGDSRAYIVAGGEARLITDDHSIVAARVAAGQITAAEARTAPDRNVLTRSIGSETDVLVDIFGPRQLKPNERLVLCTDGVHGMIDDDAIGRLGGGLPIAESAGMLVTAAVEAGGRDNATALVGGYWSAGAGVPPPLAAAPRRTGHRPPVRSVVAAVLAAIGLAVLAFLALGAFGASPSATGIPTPSATTGPTLDVTASPTRTRSATATATATATLTQIPGQRPTPAPKRTPSPTPTRIPSPAPTPAPTPVMFAKIVQANPPAVSPGDGLFTVESLPLASCTLSGVASGDSLQESPAFTIDDQGSSSKPWGANWSIHNVTVTVSATCLAAAPDGRMAQSATVDVLWP